MLGAIRRLIGPGGKPSDYRLTLNIGAGRHGIGFDDSRVSDVAEQWDGTGAGIAYALPENVDRLMWGAQPFRFAELFPGGYWPPFLVFDLEKPRGEFGEKCAVVVRLLDDEQKEIFTSHIKLASPRTLIVPISSEVRGLITHIRLQGSGFLSPLRMTLSVPNRTAVEQYRSGSSRASEVAGARKSKGLLASVERAAENGFAWDGVLRETHAHDNSHYRIGVLSAERAAKFGEFVAIRADQGVLAHSYVRCAGYIFEDAAAETQFGWQGVMTPANNLANITLARHLAGCRRNGLSTILLFDDATLQKPFFEDFRKAFDECLPASEAERLFETESLPQ